MEAMVELRKKKARRVALHEELARLDVELGGEEK